MEPSTPAIRRRFSGAAIIKQLRDQGIADRLDTLYADGSLAYSSQPALLQSPVIATGVARDAIRYDFFRLDRHHIGVAVVDVSGKGVPAALFMVMARTLMRATAVQHVGAPGRVLASVNDFLGNL